MVRYPLLVVNVAALLLSACSTGPCGPSTCIGGCCTATGECVSANNLTCGKEGAACSQCAAGETCTVGVCLPGGTGGGSGGGTGGGTGGSGGSTTPRCMSTAVQCQDQSIMQLPFRMTINPDAVTEEGTAPNFRTRIDARAGGSNPMTSFQYLSFTDSGLVKHDIHDETSLISLDWDIAVRRYVIRVNSGVGGPSCVEAARTAPGTNFDTLTQAPAGLSWRTEQYFTPPTCDFVADTSGIGAPATALSSFWTYMSCVQMTGNVYVVRTRFDRYVKLQVTSYYTPSAQTICDQGGTLPTPNEAGVVRIRWGFIGAPP